jgi:hypothetical protein
MTGLAVGWVALANPIKCRISSCIRKEYPVFSTKKKTYLNKNEP